MNNRMFNPDVDLPKCDICGAVMIYMQTTLPERGSCLNLGYSATFACGAHWTATRRVDFKRNADMVPNGNYSAYDSAPTTFLEDKPCKHAARIARKLRADAGVTPE